MVPLDSRKGPEKAALKNAEARERISLWTEKQYSSGPTRMVARLVKGKSL